MISGLAQHELCFRIFAVGDVNHRYAQADADLRRGQTHALRGVHGLKHVRGERLQLLVEFLDRLRGGFKNRVAVFYDRMNHRASSAMKTHSPQNLSNCFW